MDTARSRAIEPHQELKLQDPTTLHPVQRIEKNRFRNHQHIKNLALSNVYGSHMVMRLEMEKRILSGFQRLPVLKSEFAGLESMTGSDLTFEFQDYLNDPWMRETAPPSVHVLMENKLGLMKHTPQELGK